MAITPIEIRELIFRELHEHPEDWKFQAQNLAKALFRDDVAWPTGWNDEQIGIAINSIISEFYRRVSYER